MFGSINAKIKFFWEVCILRKKRIGEVPVSALYIRGNKKQENIFFKITTECHVPAKVDQGEVVGNGVAERINPNELVRTL